MPRRRAINSNENSREEQIFYHIDLDWYQENDRSFSAFVCSRLCREHRQGQEEPSRILGILRDCCSKQGAFLSQSLPLLESVFRLILASANEPISLDEIVQRLTELRRTSIDSGMLRRLLDHDEFYGLRSLPVESTKEKNS